MADEGPPPSKRVKTNRDEIEKLSRDELLVRLAEQEDYIEALISKHGSGSGSASEELAGLRESEEKLKSQQIEATRRENVLVLRLTTKEQEMADFVNQIQELKQAQNPSTAQLRSMLLDPAINLMFQRMKKEMDICKEKLEQAQNDLAAWKFTPDSQTGKRLMAKCRMLLQENEELGKVISSGRTAKLEGEIALEKTLVSEMKISQAEMDEFLVELDEDVEGMQSTIYFLQKQLKDSKDQIAQLQKDNELLRTQGGGAGAASTASRDSSVLHNQQESNSQQRTQQPHNVVSNHNSQHRHPQTSNGSHHVAMETDTSDGQQESCDEATGSEEQAPTSHTLYTRSQHQTSSNKQVNSHPPSSSSRNYPPSADNTDGTSSEGWSPQPSKQQTGAMAMKDDTSQRERTATKGAAVHSGDAGLPNGQAAPQYDSQGDEEDAI
jgi:hypothetical protein